MTKRMEFLVSTEENQRGKTTDERQVQADVREAGQAVLAALEKWGILGRGQIEGLLFEPDLEPARRVKLFFNGPFRNQYRGSSYKVLKRLEAAGLVRRHGFTNVSLYTLTGRGHSFMRQRRLARLPGFRSSMAPALIPHEILANGIGLTIHSLLGLPVSNEFERYIRTRYSKPDASPRGWSLSDLWISDAQCPKAIEVEWTLKDSSRYRRLWTSYRAGLPREAVLLYIAAWPRGARAIIYQARRFLMDFIYVCDVADFEASLGTCPFVGYRGGQIRLEKRPGHLQLPQSVAVPDGAADQMEPVPSGGK